jgi:hypothetical protein
MSVVPFSMRPMPTHRVKSGLNWIESKIRFAVVAVGGAVKNRPAFCGMELVPASSGAAMLEKMTFGGAEYAAPIADNTHAEISSFFILFRFL